MRTLNQYVSQLVSWTNDETGGSRAGQPCSGGGGGGAGGPTLFEQQVNAQLVANCLPPRAEVWYAPPSPAAEHAELNTHITTVGSVSDAPLTAETLRLAMEVLNRRQGASAYWSTGMVPQSYPLDMQTPAPPPEVKRPPIPIVTLDAPRLIRVD